MPERVRPFIAIAPCVGRAADADAIENQNQGPHWLTRGIGVMECGSNGFVNGASLHYSTTPILHLSEPDGMPRGFHLDRIENPIRVLRLGLRPAGRRQVPPKIAFHVQRAAAL